jgi:hypothetical protein
MAAITLRSIPIDRTSSSSSSSSRMVRFHVARGGNAGAAGRAGQGRMGVYVERRGCVHTGRDAMRCDAGASARVPIRRGWGDGTCIREGARIRRRAHPPGHGADTERRFLFALPGVQAVCGDWSPGAHHLWPRRRQAGHHSGRDRPEPGTRTPTPAPLPTHDRTPFTHTCAPKLAHTRPRLRRTHTLLLRRARLCMHACQLATLAPPVRRRC